MKPNKIWAVSHVDVPLVDGSTRRCNKKENVDKAIEQDIMARSMQAKSAPICQGALVNLLGYRADMKTAIEILERTFVVPVNTDGPTLLLFDETDNIWHKMEQGEVDIVVNVDNFQHYWKQAKERTDLSYSKLHFGHYKSGAHSKLLSEVHALKLSLITKTGSAPERWARGLSVILEKISRVALVIKLQAIVLMKADFNFHNKLILDNRMLDLARKHELVLEEFFSKKRQTTEDAILHQVLAYNIARQKQASDYCGVSRRGPVLQQSGQRNGSTHIACIKISRKLS